jgi:phospholipase C
MSNAIRITLSAALIAAGLAGARPAMADGNLSNVQHIIVIVQENHSYDNYFGVLAYAPGSPYHNGNGACKATNHQCVDGLTCTSSGGNLTCSNYNLDSAGARVYATHSNTRCITDPDHSWFGEHHDLNWLEPNDALENPLMNGFEDDDEPINGDQVMYYYSQADLPYYYSVAQTFAVCGHGWTHFPQPRLPGSGDLVRTPDYQRHCSSSRRLPAHHRQHLQLAQQCRCFLGRLFPGCPHQRLL